MTPSSAFILLVGDELLAGEVDDKNGPFFAEALSACGYRITGISIVPDKRERIMLALQTAQSVANLIIVAGGLGPTSDDLTTEAVANFCGLKTALDQAQWQRIQAAFMALRGLPPPPGNEKQATIPVAADPLANSHGTALGYALEHNGKYIAVFPGPPKENQPMFQQQFLPWLRSKTGSNSDYITRVFRVFGLAESVIGYRLADLEAELHKVKVAYQFHFPEILVKLRYSTAAQAEAEAASFALKQALGTHVYAEGQQQLPAVLGQALAARGETLVVAESCTGGWASKLLTDTAGSSAWFERGFVTYTNLAKREVLRVPREILQAHGAVSEETALAMLEGALERSPATYGFAITGVAGPGGGNEQKPVGTVCIAWGGRQGMQASTYRFHWDRDYNRLISAWTAMWNIYELVREPV